MILSRNHTDIMALKSQSWKAKSTLIQIELNYLNLEINMEITLDTFRDKWRQREQNIRLGMCSND